MFNEKGSVIDGNVFVLVYGVYWKVVESLEEYDKHWSLASFAHIPFVALRADGSWLRFDLTTAGLRFTERGMVESSRIVEEAKKEGKQTHILRPTLNGYHDNTFITFHGYQLFTLMRVVPALVALLDDPANFESAETYYRRTGTPTIPLAEAETSSIPAAA